MADFLPKTPCRQRRLAAQQNAVPGSKQDCSCRSIRKGRENSFDLTGQRHCLQHLYDAGGAIVLFSAGRIAGPVFGSKHQPVAAYQPLQPHLMQGFGRCMSAFRKQIQRLRCAAPLLLSGTG